MTKYFTLLIVLTLWIATPAVAEDDDQTAQRLDVTVHIEMGYLLSLPKGYEEKESWPLLLFLHGSGERGDDLELVKKHGPPKLIAEGKDFPFIVVSPQCPSGQSWEPYELNVLLNDLSGKYKVDQDRIYVTGLSMGGFGTWRLAVAMPRRFAAIAPVCGGGDLSSARRLRSLPIWVFHGAKDKAVPVELSEEMVAAIEKAGGTPKLTIYPDAEHDSWTETYNNPDLYEWLLAQKRSDIEAGPRERR